MSNIVVEQNVNENTRWSLGRKTTIWLMRHSIREDLNQRPESDCSITVDGVALAQASADLIAQKMKERGVLQLIFHRAFVSPYKRTIETAYSVLSRIPCQTVEIDSRIAETLTDYYWQGVSLPLALTTYLNAQNITLPESLQQVQKRIGSFAQKCATLAAINVECHSAPPYNNLFVCTHAGVLGELVRFFVPGSEPIRPKYCGCVVLEYDPSTVSPAWSIVDNF